MTSLPSNTIKPSWMTRPVVTAVVAALGAENIRFVGGAVRDGLLGKELKDLDAATRLKPDDVMRLLVEAGVKVIPTGIEHGTVTAVVDKQTIEITTLRIDVETDGRHAVVEHTDDWEADAARRDFTMNAIYLDNHGKRYDYFGGVTDLFNGVVRFIGDADERIKEDALRIMRFFRFYAWFGKGEADISALEACFKNKSMLDDLSIERVRDELLKLLTAQDPRKAVHFMQTTSVLQAIMPEVSSINDFCDVIDREQGKAANLEARILALIGRTDTEIFAKRFCFSNKQAKALKAARQAGVLDLNDDQGALLALYRYGYDALVSACLLVGSKLYRDLSDDDRPVFPVQGKDLLALGMEAGPNLGEALSKIEQRWIDSGFQLSKTDLLVL